MIKKWFLNVVLERQLPTLSRHILVMLSAMMANYGIQATGGSLVEVLTALVMFLFAWLWSVSGRKALSSSGMETLHQIAGSLARHAVTFIATLLSVDPGNELSFEAALLLGAQFAMRFFSEGAKGAAELRPPKAEPVD